MNVVMIGSGYVGLVSGACFSEVGAAVTCVDKDERKISALLRGEIPIYEPGLDEMVARNVKTGHLRFSTELEDAVRQADLIFVAVGTPTRQGDGRAELKYVYAAAEEIAGYLEGYTVIVNKSTVPVGTARQVHRIVSAANPEADFDVASNPEFLREGSAIEDFMHPDKLILGVESERAERKLRELYLPLNLVKTPIHVTNLESAELIKHSVNAFLATKIGFINEMSQLAERVGADIQSIATGMGLDHRIGIEFLRPGPGYGGSCLTKDTLALIRSAQENGSSCRIVEAVAEVNAAQKARMVAKIRNALGGSVENKTIAVLGLTFKPETDDMRDSPSLTILPALADRGAILRAHDPVGEETARMLLPDCVDYCDSIGEAIDSADAVVLMTEWKQYRDLDLEEVRRSMNGNVFVDLRNVYERAVMQEAGFQYHCVGR